MCLTCVEACASQKKALDQVGMELQMVVYYQVGAMEWNWILCKSNMCVLSLSHVSKSPFPFFILSVVVSIYVYKSHSHDVTAFLKYSFKIKWINNLLLGLFHLIWWCYSIPLLIMIMFQGYCLSFNSSWLRDFMFFIYSNSQIWAWWYSWETLIQESL